MRALAPTVMLLLAAVTLAPTSSAIACLQYLRPNAEDLQDFVRCETRFEVKPPPPPGPGSPPEAYPAWAISVIEWAAEMGVCMTEDTPPRIEYNPGCGPKDTGESGEPGPTQDLFVTLP